MNLVLERIGDSASAAQKKSATPETVLAPCVSRVHLSAVLRSKQEEAARERIRRLFHSPLGVYVSQASRDHDDLRLIFDVAMEDLDFTVRTLHQVLPEAVIEAVRPRIFTHRREH
ncbi:hypothetical protein M0D69_38385 [Caballeronia sp. SEWSISQ10-4 2]|uniref:hypothetical protein n=1 Tax=Caballeronia sp. SEWSISQ10-4 2 TaxID=2937438 RepID=UPI00264FA2C6|nr:hypothetical protein [Caballeronia sp. SEWSISQ10-4 2]MDN7183783.1 hypothetical protein [Caballeronia sp. SEWSISQ10-4 2]